MIVRIVQLYFKTEHIEAFQQLFAQHKLKIRQQEGCQLLELYQDAREAGIFFTYSYWDHEQALNNYRKSTLFQEVWPATRALFAAPPRAHTVHKITSLP